MQVLLLCSSLQVHHADAFLGEEQNGVSLHVDLIAHALMSDNLHCVEQNWACGTADVLLGGKGQTACCCAPK